MRMALLAHPITTDRVTALVAVLTAALVVLLAAAVGVVLKLIAAMVMDVSKEGWEVSRRLLVADLMW